MANTIVSKEFAHNGGVARIEQKPNGGLIVKCTGCNTEKPAAATAPALSDLVNNHQ